jgi:hypothetical protein
MNTVKEVIQKAHAAQVDAGSQENFTDKVVSAIGVSTDPVAAFLAAILTSSDEIDDIRSDINFYGSEVARIVDSFNKGV